jgi:transcription elongation factor GreA
VKYCDYYFSFSEVYLILSQEESRFIRILSLFFYTNGKFGGAEMTKGTYLTQEGLKKLREDLDYLMNVERPRISKQIGEAIDKGDISENAEYDAAKDAQGLLEAKIANLQNKIAHARILDESKIDTSQVQILNKVTIKNQKNNTTMVYTIVPESEANLKEGKLSVTTPIAQGLIGKKVGDIVNIKVPAGIIPFEIVEIAL